MKRMLFMWAALMVAAGMVALACSSGKSKGPGDDDDQLNGGGDTDIVVSDTEGSLPDLSDETGDGLIADGDEVSDSDQPTDGTQLPDDGQVPDGDEILITDSDSPHAGMGPGTENGYDEGSSNADNVKVNENGELELDNGSETVQTLLRYLWVPNSVDGTMSKIDTFDKIEVGRYHVGLSAASDPSRTSVDLAGNMIVGARGDGTVTKIAGHLDFCVDRNGDNIIQTSTGPNDILPRGPDGRSTDECVVWVRWFDPSDLNSPYACNGIRGVAATPETGSNFEYTGHVMIGCYLGDPYSYRLNGNTGDIMNVFSMVSEVDQTCRPYGYVLDKYGRNWVSCRYIPEWQTPVTGGLAWFDIYDPSEKIHYVTDIPSYEGFAGYYGIAIDRWSNIWITSFTDGYVHRYTPDSSPNADQGTWTPLKVGFTHGFRGIAADDDGYIWAISTEEQDGLGSRIVMIDGYTYPDPASVHGPYYLGDGTVTPFQGTGVGVDFKGDVWGMSRCGGGQGYVTYLKVDRSGAMPSVVEAEKKIIPVGNGPYVYSDMLGYNLKKFASKEGWFRHTFEVCASSLSTDWEKIYWEANVPQDTRVIIRARTSDKESELPFQPWQILVEVPSDISPKDIPDTLPQGHYIELEVRLYSKVVGVSPTVGQIAFDYECVDPS